MKIISTYLVLLTLSSCATSSIHTEALKEVSKPYQRLLTLYIEKPLTLQHFDSTFYTDAVEDNFNDLRTLPVRAQMEKTLMRNLSYPQTQVISSSKIFGLNTAVDYALFRSKLDSTGADAILLINEDQYWETHRYNRIGSSWTADSQPNSAFHFYLIEARSGEILWLGRCTVQGINAGYDVLNNMLARKVTRELKSKKYIL